MDQNGEYPQNGDPSGVPGDIKQHQYAYDNSVPYDAYGYPQGGDGYPYPTQGIQHMGYPQNQIPAGYPQQGMTPGDIQMQQQLAHQQMMYAQQQQPDPAAVYAYYQQAAERGDPAAVSAMQAFQGGLSTSPGGTTVTLGSPERPDPTLSPAHAEALYAQMRHLQTQQMHAAQMWNGGFDQVRAWDPWFRGGANGAGDGINAHAGYRTNGWKPPSPRGRGGRGGGSYKNRRGAMHGEWIPGGVHQNGEGHYGQGYHGAYHRRGNARQNDTPSSPLLEQFKLHKNQRNENARFELSDIAGHVTEFACDQYGSRFIQQKLETATDTEIVAILQEILPNFKTLAVDVFGNYVAQKFFEKADDAQRETLSEQLVGHVLRLSLHMYGCRLVQKALETVTKNRAMQLVKELDQNVLRCVRDQNGNHVVQKTIECVPVDELKFVLDSLKGNIVSLSVHPYGCRVIQRCLERFDPFAGDEEKDDETVDEPKDSSKDSSSDLTPLRFNTREILTSAAQLAKDQYGNYVMQHVLQHGDHASRKHVLSVLAVQIVPLAQHKFASNVVEKCLVYCGVEEREIMIGEILGDSNRGESGAGDETAGEEATVSGSASSHIPSDIPPPAPVCPLPQMMKDQFANYVVQKLLEVCNTDQRERLLKEARSYLRDVKKFTYGKHIVARVEKLADLAGAVSEGTEGEQTQPDASDEQTQPEAPEKNKEEGT